MDPFSLSVGAFSTLATLTHLTRRLIELVQDVRGAPREISSAAVELKTFRNVIDEIEGLIRKGLIPHATAEGLEAPLDACSHAVQELESKLVPHVVQQGDRHVWRVMKWALGDKKRVEELTASLRTHRSSLNTCISVYVVLKDAGKLDELQDNTKNLTDQARLHHEELLAASADTAAQVKTLGSQLNNLSKPSSETLLTSRTDIQELMRSELRALLETHQTSAGIVKPPKDKEEDFVNLVTRLKGHDEAEALRRFFAESTVTDPLSTEKSDIANIQSLEDEWDTVDELDPFGPNVDERVAMYLESSQPDVALLIAATVGDKNVVQRLAEKGARLDTCNEDGQNALLLAAKSDHKALVKFLLDNKVNVNSVDGEGVSALHLACRNGFISLSTLLLGVGADPNIRSLEGRTPLHEAIESDRWQVIEELAKHGADLMARDKGQSAVHKVALRGTSMLPFLRILLDSGADVNVRDLTTGGTALHVVPFADVASVLLEYGADIEAQDDSSNTPLLAATTRQDQSLLNLLISRGANIEARNSAGDTALGVAASLDAAHLVNDLLSSGADVESRSNNRSTPLLHATVAPGDTALETLVQRADVSMRKGDRWTAFHCAAFHNQLRSTCTLAAAYPDFDYNTVDKDQYTPAHRAASRNSVDVLPFLLEHGANVDICNAAGLMPLHEAASARALRSAQILLEHGADIHSDTKENELMWTPLFYALYNDDLAMVQLLVGHGASVERTSPKGFHSLHICAWFNAHTTTEYLLKCSPSLLNSFSKADCTSLYYAAVKGHEPIIRQLLDHGADPSLVNVSQATVLGAYLQNPGTKSISTVEYLIERGADVNTSHRQMPILYVAALEGLGQAIIKCLVRHGADTEALDSIHNSPLFIAASGKSLETFQELLDLGANVEQRNNTGETALIRAAATGNKAFVRALLDRGANLEVRDNSGRNAFDHAVMGGHHDVANLFAGKGSTTSLSFVHVLAMHAEPHELTSFLDRQPEALNETDERGRTPLNRACGQYRNLNVALLVDRGADIHLKDNDGFTPLAAAAVYGSLPSVRCLLKAGARTEDATSMGKTALHLAVESTDPEVVEALLDAGAILESLASNAETPLHTAARSKANGAIIRVLVERGANKDAAQEWGYTPLMLALDAQQIQNALCLIEVGCNLAVRAKPRHGFATALHVAAAKNDDPALIYKMLDKGAFIEARTDKGATPLQVAAAWGRDSSIRALLQRGADIEAGHYDCALHCAVTNGWLSTVKLLISNGASIKTVSKTEWNALHLAACHNRSAEIMEYLLSEGCELEARTNLGRTPAMVAAWNSNMVPLKYLLERGANIEPQDHEGYNMLLMAVHYELEPVVRMLLEHGADMSAQGTEHLLSPLLLAAKRHNRANILQILLEHGASLEQETRQGDGPLATAASAGKLAIVKQLLQRKADIEQVNKNLLTPLHQAICGASTQLSDAPNGEVALELISAGANVRATNEHGIGAIHMATLRNQTNVVAAILKIDPDLARLRISKPGSEWRDGLEPLHLAAVVGADRSIFQLLLENGADIEATEPRFKKTPLLLANERAPVLDCLGQTEQSIFATIQLISDLGGDINARNSEDMGVLELAIWYNRPELARQLIDKHTLNPKTASSDGLSLLQLAAYQCGAATVNFLLNQGVDPLQQEDQLGTPLHRAAALGRLDTLQAFCDSGVYGSCNLLNKSGKTPLDCALAQRKFLAESTDAVSRAKVDIMDKKIAILEKYEASQELAPPSGTKLAGGKFDHLPTLPKANQPPKRASTS